MFQISKGKMQKKHNLSKTVLITATQLIS